MNLEQTRASAKALVELKDDNLSHPIPAAARELLASFIQHTEPTEAVEPIMQFFAFEHLPAHLQTVSQNFHALAQHLVDNLPRNPERTVALRKLLEAKDAAVRARLFKEVV